MKKLFLILSLSPATFNNFIVKRKVLFIFVCLLIYHIANIAYAQPSMTWQRLYRSSLSGNSYGNDLCQASDGNFVLVGGTNNNQKGLAIKINGFGDTIWSRIISNREVYTVTATNTGGCAIAGRNSLIILNTNGTILLDTVFTQYLPTVYDIKQTQDNGYVLCGSITDDRGYIAKINSNGSLLWEKVYHQVFYEALYSLTDAIDSGFVSIGGYLQTVPGQAKIYFVKFDNQGNQQWENIYTFDSLAGVGGVGYKVINQNQIYTVLSGHGVTKIDRYGTQVYSTYFGLDSNETPVDMQILPTNNFLLATIKITNNPYNIKSNLKIYDTSGSIIHQKQITVPDFTQLKSILKLTNGDCIAIGTGDYDSSNSGSYFFVIRADSSLNSPPISISSITDKIPSEFKLFQNYPNPFNGSTVIAFNIAKTDYYTLELYDIIGRKIDQLFSGSLKAGFYKINYNNLNISSGTYFYRITVRQDAGSSTGSYFKTNKMILIK